MQRSTDWEALLGAYLERVRETPFAWGRHDCCTFSLGAVETMTGVDTMPEFRGRYTTARGSVRALRKFGAGTLADTLTAKFGEPIHPAHARRGDLVMDDSAVGVCMGDYAIFVGIGDIVGLGKVPRAEWTQGWRVPFEAPHVG